MKRDYKDYVIDILQSIETIEKFIKGLSFQNFREDEKTIFAVVRALEVIGEAVKKIPPDIKKKYKQVPWKKMAGMRDKLIHEYFGLNTKVVWRTVKDELPQVRPQIEEILKDHIREN